MEYAQIVKLLLHCSVVGVAWFQSVCAIIPTPCHSLTMTAMELARAQKDLGPGYSHATKLYDFRFGQMANKPFTFIYYCVYSYLEEELYIFFKEGFFFFVIYFSTTSAKTIFNGYMYCMMCRISHLHLSYYCFSVRIFFKYIVIVMFHFCLCRSVLGVWHYYPS